MDPLTLVMLAILAMLIFFMWRNSKKRKEETARLQDLMMPGAEVMTNFGLFGTLISIDDENNVAVLETSPGSQVRVHRQTLARVVDDEAAIEESIDADADIDAAVDSSVSDRVAEPRKSDD